MGFLLVPTLSHIFMGIMKRKVISKYKTHFRYVDDCFLLGKNKKEIDEHNYYLKKHIYQ